MKIVFHLDVHNIYPCGAGCLATASHRWEEEVVGHNDVHSELRIWCVDGDERSIRAPGDPRGYWLRSRPPSRCALPLTEDEVLTRRDDLGLWVRLIPVGWRVPWYNQRVLTAY